MQTINHTYYVGRKAAQASYYAGEQAERIGLPLNKAVTINFGLTRVDPREATEIFKKIRKNYYVPWARRAKKRGEPGFAPTYAYAFENRRDGVPFMTMEPGDPHNVHVHWEVHVPPECGTEFDDQVWRWLEAVAGRVEAGAIHIRPLPGSTGYLAKGARPWDAERYARGRLAEEQGIIVGGRRADTSRNIGPTPRRRHDRLLGLSRKLPAYRSDGRDSSHSISMV